MALQRRPTKKIISDSMENSIKVTFRIVLNNRDFFIIVGSTIGTYLNAKNITYKRSRRIGKITYLSKFYTYRVLSELLQIFLDIAIDPFSNKTFFN